MKRLFILSLILGLFVSISLARNPCELLVAQGSQEHQAPIDSPDDIRVWVNTDSGVYHCPGAEWYGKTKHGKYMTQKQAKEKGYHPAGNNPCA
jgi:hypothetical protein